MPTVLLQNRLFSYTVIRKPVRSLSLRFVDRNSFKISCPRLTPDFVIRRFIGGHSAWILKSSANFAARKSVLDLKTIQILGETYELIIKKTTRDSVVIFKDEHKIYANVSQLDQNYLKKLLDAKFRPLAMSLITSGLRELSRNYGFHYGRVSVKNTTSRFGSCSASGNLNFNWQIILFPPHIFRHILLHELTHTVHHNHSASFWRQFSLTDPEYRSHRTWLKKEGSKYFIV